MGRESKYSKEIADDVCERIATSSKGLNAVCKEVGISPRTFYRWLELHEDLRQSYARARDEQADLLADEIIEIADDSSGDLKMGDKGEYVDHENIQRSKLKVDARKWRAGKLKPKVYGDKIDHTTDGEKITDNKLVIIRKVI